MTKSSSSYMSVSLRYTSEFDLKMYFLGEILELLIFEFLCSDY